MSGSPWTVNVPALALVQAEPAERMPAEPAPPPQDRILLNTGPSRRGAHRLQNALTCPALYAFKNVIRHEAALGGRDPLVRGSIGHAALAHHYARLGAVQHGLDPEAYYTPHDAIDLVAPTFGDIGHKFQRLIHNAYDAYARFYAVEREEVVAVEYAVETQVPHPYAPSVTYDFTQRWDLVTKDGGGRYWLTDHKFVAKADQRTVQRYALSIQFTSMVWLAHKIIGSAFGGVRLNLVGVGNGETFQFVRPVLPPAPDAVRRFPETIMLAEQRIADVERLSTPWDAPRVYSEMVCMTPYGACDCFELCRFGKDHITFDGRVF